MGILMLYNNFLSPTNGKDRAKQRIKQSFSEFVFCRIKFSVTVKINMYDYAF
jgi:hypothetical protein